MRDTTAQIEFELSTGVPKSGIQLKPKDMTID